MNKTQKLEPSNPDPESKPMRLLYYYDDTWVKMKEHFEQSFKDDWITNPINTSSIRPEDQQSEPAEFHKGKPVNNKSSIGGGMGSWLTKVDMIIDALHQGLDTLEIVTVADTDIVFYRPVQPLIRECMRWVDMCFQKENHGIKSKSVNIGFISLRCCPRVIEFWEHVRDQIISTQQWDQQVVNMHLQRGKKLPPWGWFPASVYCKTHVGPLPKDMVLHHANATKSMESKFEQFYTTRREWRKQHYSAVQPHNTRQTNEISHQT